MQKYYKIFLLFIVIGIFIGVLYGVTFVFCENSKEHEKREKLKALEIEDFTLETSRIDSASSNISGGGGPFFPPPLWAHGDYTKLKLIIRSNKKNYNPDEPVSIMFFLRNDSDSEIHVQDSFGIEHSWCFGKLFYSNHDEVPLVSVWQNLRQNRESEEFERTLRGKHASGLHIKFQPGEERQFFGSTVEQLSGYFDLSKPDAYELTCFLATACFGQYYDPPLQSNTLTFRILEEGEKAENVETEMNPPKGKEVFKQPRPPKSVFYVYEDEPEGHFYIVSKDGRLTRSTPGPRKLIDISPETYYRQMAKEQQ